MSGLYSGGDADGGTPAGACCAVSVFGAFRSSGSARAARAAPRAIARLRYEFVSSSFVCARDPVYRRVTVSLPCTVAHVWSRASTLDRPCELSTCELKVQVYTKYCAPGTGDRA